MNNQPTKLKRVVIKEELVELTGDHTKALILNQFLYWGERTKDTDQFIQEEKVRDPSSNTEPTYGWIYKSAEELSNELMLGVSASTMRRHLSDIVESGYIDQRHNPNHKWDRKLQYRPNIIKIQTDLHALGYNLEGYPILENAFSKMKNRSLQNEGALAEITIETTTENMPQGGDGDFSDLFPEPLQADSTIKKLDDNGKAHLLTFGVLPSDKTDPKEHAVKQELLSADWQIHSPDVELAIVYFVLAVRAHHPDFAIPNDDVTRKDWYKSVAGHLKNHPLSELQNLYNLAIIKMIDKDLSYWRPGSLTKWAIPEADSFGKEKKSIVSTKGGFYI